MENELHLDEFIIINKATENKETTYTVAPNTPSRKCEKCGSFNTVFNGEAPSRYIRDLPSFGYETTILLKQKRIWCRDCNSTSLQSFSSIDSRDRITKRLREQIQKEYLDYWYEEIFNYFLHPYTNGVVEALNNVIKELEKRGKGYSFDVLKAKVLFGTKATKKPAYKRKPIPKKVMKSV